MLESERLSEVSARSQQDFSEVAARLQPGLFGLLFQEIGLKLRLYGFRLDLGQVLLRSGTRK